MRKYLFFIVTLVWGLAACTSVFPTPELAPKFRFQYACINRGLDPCAAAEEFANRVQDRTNGEVEIQISSFSELSLDHIDSLRLMEDGTLGLAEIYTRYINKRNEKKLAILNMDTLWGLYQDYDTQMMVTAAIREEIDKIIETRSGGIVLAYQFYPSNYLFSKKPLRTATDIKGLNIRTNSMISHDLLAGMGANPLNIQFSKVKAALEAEPLDAAVSCVRCGIGLRWYESAHYLVGPITALSHTWITMNRDRWDELPADIQAIILEEAKRHEELTRKMSVDIWAGVEENQKSEMEYIELTPELKDLAAEAARTRVLPGWLIRAELPDSEAHRIYNLKVAPILKIKINADGQAEGVK